MSASARTGAGHDIACYHLVQCCDRAVGIAHQSADPMDLSHKLTCHVSAVVSTGIDDERLHFDTPVSGARAPSAVRGAVSRRACRCSRRKAMTAIRGSDSMIRNRAHREDRARTSWRYSPRHSSSAAVLVNRSASAANAAPSISASPRSAGSVTNLSVIPTPLPLRRRTRIGSGNRRYRWSPSHRGSRCRS